MTYKFITYKLQIYMNDVILLLSRSSNQVYQSKYSCDEKCALEAYLNQQKVVTLPYIYIGGLQRTHATLDKFKVMY